MMPRKFVEKYGKGLPKAICVETPNGAKWKLNLVKSDGKIWFEKGWKEFAEYHSLAHGHLLLFRYEKTSKFEVHIFEKNALEINYSIKRVEAKKVSNGQGNKPPNGENRRAAQKRKDNSSFEFHQQCEIGSSSCVKHGKSQKVDVHQIDRMSKGTRFYVFFIVSVKLHVNINLIVFVLFISYIIIFIFWTFKVWSSNSI